jgi:hypothetical protein
VHAAIMKAGMVSASKCDDGMLRVCSVHALTYARYIFTAHAKHDVSVDRDGGHGMRDPERPRP